MGQITRDRDSKVSKKPILFKDHELKMLWRNSDNKILTLEEVFDGFYRKGWTSTSSGFVAPTDSALAGSVATRTGIVVYKALGTYAEPGTTQYTQPFWGVTTPLVYMQVSTGTAINLGRLLDIKKAGAAKIDFGFGQSYYGNVLPQVEHSVTITPKPGTEDYLVNGSDGGFIVGHAVDVTLVKGGTVQALYTNGGGRWIKVHIYRDTNNIIYYRYTSYSSVTAQWACRPMAVATWK